MMKQFYLYAILLLMIGACGQTPKSAANQPVVASTDISQYHAALLIMPGVYNTELVAPMDIFQHTKFREGIKSMRVFTVAQNKAAIKTFEGLSIIPDFAFSDESLPRIDILVVPSAEHHLDSDLANTTLIQWVRETGLQARFVISLCDGAFVLAKAGLLDSVTCTTYPDDIPQLRQMFPSLQVQEDVSFVFDQKYITSAGGAKSFDAALFLCEHLYGKEIADQLAHGLVIDWDLNAIKKKIVDRNVTVQ